MYNKSVLLQILAVNALKLGKLVGYLLKITCTTMLQMHNDCLDSCSYSTAMETHFHSLALRHMPKNLQTLDPKQTGRQLL